MVAQFVERYRIKVCREQRTKAMDNESFREKLMKWHTTLKEHLIRSSSDLDEHVWGQFTPETPFNMDHVPLFAVDCSQTYDAPLTK